jgi:hypothetical protein
MEVVAPELGGEGCSGPSKAEAERIEDTRLAVVVLTDEHGDTIEVELQPANAPEVLDEDPGESHA